MQKASCGQLTEAHEREAALRRAHPVVFGLRVWLAVFGLPLLSILPLANSQEAPVATPKSTLIVEVIAIDNQLHSKVKYVYLRAYSDGSVEYHDRWHIDLFNPSPTRVKLSAEQLNRLEKILSEPETLKLAGEYHGGQGVDTSLRWDVTIPTPDGTHTFTLWNFTYRFDHGLLPGRPIGDSARKVGCALEEMSHELKGWQPFSPPSPHCNR